MDWPHLEGTYWLCYKESLEMDSPRQTEKGMPKNTCGWCLGWDEELGPHLDHTQKTNLGQEEVKEGDHCWLMLQEEIRA